MRDDGGEGVSKIVKNCVTSFMDEISLQNLGCNVGAFAPNIGCQYKALKIFSANEVNQIVFRCSLSVELFYFGQNLSV